MGEKQNRSFQFCFNGFLKVDFQGSRVTSDGGLILIRELDEHLGMNRLIEQCNAPRSFSPILAGAVSSSFSACQGGCRLSVCEMG